MSSDSPKKKVLIGSCGGLTGVYLAKRLRLLEGLEIWGADVSSDNPCKFFLDNQVCLPLATSPEFIRNLIALLNCQQIDYYLPTHSKETRAVAKAERALSATHARFIVSPEETFDDLDDKSNAARNLRAAGIPAPRYFEDIGEIDSYPVFVKKAIGSGSSGAMIVRSAEELSALAGRGEGYSAFEYLDGEEYTVDCMFDFDGRLLAYNQRRRVKTLGGAVIITENDHTIDVGPWIRRMASNWVFRGCVNFQYFLRDGEPCFFDVNLRYPSGGLPLSVESGVDVPEMTIRLLAGDSIGPDEYKSDRAKRRMYRYFEERFEECG